MGVRLFTAGIGKQDEIGRISRWWRPINMAVLSTQPMPPPAVESARLRFALPGFGCFGFSNQLGSIFGRCVVL